VCARSESFKVARRVEIVFPGCIKDAEQACVPFLLWGGEDFVDSANSQIRQGTIDRFVWDMQIGFVIDTAYVVHASLSRYCLILKSLFPMPCASYQCTSARRRGP